MGRELLSEYQIKSLRKSPHVCFVSEVMISFTAGFKRYFYEEHKKGKSPRTILRESGIDPELMGEKRIHSLRTVVMGQSKRGNEFSDTNCKVPTPPSRKAERATDDKIARLEHEVAYTRQEVEYLKKIYMADKEAARAWLSKQNQKQSSESSEK